MTLLSRLMSIVLHPFLMPVYGFLLLMSYTYLAMTSTSFKNNLLLVVSIFTIILPLLLLLIMYIFGLTNSVTLKERKDRILPYLFIAMCYGGLVVMLYRMKLPLWVVQTMSGAVVSIVIALFVSLRWKISAHMTGIGGLIAGVLVVSGIFRMMPVMLIIGLFILAGMLGVSRVFLKAHTPAQVYAGFCNGFVCVILSNVFNPVIFL